MLLNFALSEHIPSSCFEETKLIGYDNKNSDYITHVSDVDLILDNHSGVDFRPRVMKYCVNADNGYLETL